jgi:hypothetical protein
VDAVPHSAERSEPQHDRERIQKRAALEEELNRRHIPFVPCIYPGPAITQPATPPVGNDADQPR